MDRFLKTYLKIQDGVLISKFRRHLQTLKYDTIPLTPYTLAEYL